MPAKRDFDKEIAVAESDLQRFVQESGNRHEKLKKQACEFFPDWFEKTAEEHAKGHSDITIQLGTQKVTAFKTAVKQLCENVESIVSKRLDIDELKWPKYVQREFPDANFDANVHLMSPRFKTALQFVGGELGPLLCDHDYFENTTEKSMWGFQTEDGLTTNSQCWDIAIAQTVHEITIVNHQAFEAERQVEDLRKMQNDAKAADIFDNA